MLIIASFAVVIFWVIGYILFMQWVKFLQWNIQINFPKKIYSYWEEVTWTVVFSAKKDMDVSACDISLIAHKSSRVYMRQHSLRKNKQLYKNTVRLYESDSLKADTNSSQVFSFTLPNIADLPDTLQKQIEVSAQRWESVSGFYTWKRKSSKVKWNFLVEIVSDSMTFYKREWIIISSSADKNQ